MKWKNSWLWRLPFSWAVLISATTICKQNKYLIASFIKIKKTKEMTAMRQWNWVRRYNTISMILFCLMKQNNHKAWIKQMKMRPTHKNSTTSCCFQDWWSRCESWRPSESKMQFQRGNRNICLLWLVFWQQISVKITTTESLCTQRVLQNQHS